jgi:SPP1 family predicted phage head-tail adaptor
MNPGDLRHRITLQQKTKIPDGQGGYTESWADFVTVWAAIETPTGQWNWKREAEAGQLQSDLEYRIRIRFQSNVTPEFRVKYGSRIFSIKSVVDVNERHQELILFCSEE